MARHSRFTCHFTGTCNKCDCTIRGCDSACQAMGKLYHAHCFYCSICGKELRGQEFYQIQDKIYCREDYKKMDCGRPPKSCYVCGKAIGEKVLETLGRIYHPGCFHCCECYVVLEGIPFTVDEHGDVFCLSDYHRKYSPRCDRCNQPITPKEESDEIIRVVCNNNQYHTECFMCENCGIQLSNDEGRQCYPINNRLYCLTCNEQRLMSPHEVVTPSIKSTKTTAYLRHTFNLNSNDSYSNV